MAKRFISTNLFDDDWFSELTKEGKLFFLYYITKCDHAGVLRLNSKLAEFQLKIKSIESVIQELGNCLVRVKEGVYFMPKFLKFQYPDFPKSNVKQQIGAIMILTELGIWDKELNSYLTVTKELPNSYDNGNVIVIEPLPKLDPFYLDFEKCELQETQIDSFKLLCEKAKLLKNVQSLKTPLTSYQLYLLIKAHGKDIVFDVLNAMENNAKLKTSYVSSYLTAQNWIKGRNK